MNAKIKDAYGELVSVGDYVWTIEWDHEFKLRIEKWQIDQILNNALVSLVFVNANGERKRVQKQSKSIAVNKQNMINQVRSIIDRQYAAYSHNLQVLDTWATQDVELQQISNKEEEL